MQYAHKLHKNIEIERLTVIGIQHRVAIIQCILERSLVSTLILETVLGDDTFFPSVLQKMPCALCVCFKGQKT